MWLRVWVQSKGGTAKASTNINVSEDIFAGFNACELAPRRAVAARQGQRVSRVVPDVAASGCLAE
jgi:hypothetical protein